MAIRLRSGRSGLVPPQVRVLSPALKVIVMKKKTNQKSNPNKNVNFEKRLLSVLPLTENIVGGVLGGFTVAIVIGWQEPFKSFYMLIWLILIIALLLVEFMLKPFLEEKANSQIIGK